MDGPVPDPDAPLILGDFLPYRLSVAAEAVSRLFAARYEARFGLAIPEWRVMAILGEASPRSTQDVIRLTGMDRVRVSRAAIRLADKGLVERRPRSDDACAQDLTLTRRGRETYRRIVPLARETQDALAAWLTPAERHQLEVLLDRITAQATALGRSPALPESQKEA